MQFRTDNYENTYMVEWFMLYKKKVQNFKMFYYNGTLPYKSCTPQVVEFIFKLADMCGVNNSVKYKCVELYDRFLSEYFIYMYTNVYNKHPNKWPKVLELLKKKSFLQVMSCMQLVSKNDQQSLSLKLKDVKTILKRTGHIYTKKNILSSEIEVFHIMGYKLNETSIFMLVEYFLVTIPYKITDNLYSTCLLLTDLVYIHQQELYDRIQYQRTGCRNYTYCEKLESLDIELDKITTAAALVITAFYLLNSTDTINEELCRDLSALCEKSTDNLIIISTVLISIINSI